MSVKGIVKNLTDYGAFVDLGGVDGLLHITDMSWKRIKHPSEIVNVGDEIDVKVLNTTASAIASPSVSSNWERIPGCYQGPLSGAFEGQGSGDQSN